MACCNLQTCFFLPAGELESELDKRGLVDQFVSMLMAAESPEHVNYLNSAFKSLVGAAQEVQQEAEEAQEVRSDAEGTAE